MVLIAMIVSGLALLAASVCLGLMAQEKKRNQKRNADVCNYADSCLIEAKEFAKKLVNNAMLEISGRFTTEGLEIQAAVDKKIEEAKASFMSGGEWEKAVAKTAEEKIAEAVNEICGKMTDAYFANDFNANLGSILGFDPYASLEAQRKKDRGEG